MEWLREIFWICIQHNIQLSPRYISSADNFLADSLSRVTGDKEIDFSCLHEGTHDCSTGGRDIRNQRQELLWTSVAPTTRACRMRHWKCYREFCEKYKLNLFPCTLMQSADYLTFLSLYMKHSSVLVYYQAVRFYHKLSHPYLKGVLAGIMNIPESRMVPKEPFNS